MQNRQLTILFILLSICIGGFANTDLRFSRIALPEIDNNTTSSIVEDSKGFVWLGTKGGLLRNDGYNTVVKPFVSSEGRIFQTPPIEKLLIIEDKMWIGTQNGIYIYDLTSETTAIFHHLNTKVECREITHLQNNNIAFGTNNGLYIYDAEKDDIEAYIFNPVSDEGLSHRIIRCIYEDKNNDLWIGTFDKLNKFDREANIFTHYQLQDENCTQKNNLILCIEPLKEAEDSILLIGTETGWCHFNTKSLTRHYFSHTSHTQLSNNVIKCSKQVNGHVWLGTDMGLNRYIPETKEFQSFFRNDQNNNTLNSNIINSIYKDSKGYIWIATDNGVNKTYAKNNLVLFNRMNNIDKAFEGSVTFNDFAEDDLGNYYFATNAGLYIYNKRLKKYTNLQPPNILHNKVTSLEIKGNKLWIGTSGGLNVYDIKTKRIKSYSANEKETEWFKTNYINKVVSGTDGAMWLYIYHDGLYKVVCNEAGLPERYINYDGKSELKTSARVSGFINFTVNSNNELWAHTDKALHKLNTTSGIIEPIYKLPTNDYYYFSNITYSGDNTIWIASTKGLIKYDIKANKGTIVSPIGDGIKTMYDNGEYLLLASVDKLYRYSKATHEVLKFPNKITGNRTYRNAFRENEAKQVFIGCQSGFISLNTSDLEPDSEKSKILIAEIRVLNKTLSPTQLNRDKTSTFNSINSVKKLELEYQENNFEVLLAFSDFSNGAFQYTLDGYDKDWFSLKEGKNLISYSRLPYGKFTLKIKGIDEYGLPCASERHIAIKVNAPFYASPLAFILYTLIFIGIILGLRKLLLVRIEYRDNLKAEIIQREKSEELIQVKSRFFTNVSHELRTPLTLILGPVERLIQNETDEEKNKTLKIIKRNTERLIRLVNQILDLRKIEKNLEPLRIQQYDIVQFCSTIYHRFEEEATHRNLKMSFVSEIPSLVLWFDVEKMEKILDNLISNALKFTQDGGKIDIKITNQYAKEVCIIISDTGIGIPKSEQEHIFERFFNTGAGSFSRQKGTGIGLSLVNEYVEMHNGTITLESDKNIGSTFRLLFPKEKHVLENYELVEEVEAFEEIEEPETFNLIGTEKSSETILLIDDEPDLLAFLKDSFSAHYNIYTATDGVKGWETALLQFPDLILSDVVMPNMDGIELCQKIKNDVRTSHIPVVLLTAKGDMDSKMSGIKTGADDYISKPFSLDYLLLRTEKIIEQRKKLQDVFKRQQKLEPTEIDIKSVDDGFLDKLMVIVEENMSNSDLSAKMLSELSGLSHSNLYRKLKTLVGQSINEFIRSVRLKRAAQLLKQGSLNVSEVMYEVGFSHHSYFTRVFKETFGMTPKEYSKDKKA